MGPEPDSYVPHQIDLCDDLGGGLNNLRFSQMMRMYKRAGFTTDARVLERRDPLTLSRDKLAPPFREVPDDSLNIAIFNVLMRPTCAG